LLELFNLGWLLLPLSESKISNLIPSTLRLQSFIMPRKYLGGSGDALTVWISIAASTVLIFYGYDQVRPNGFLDQVF
jgi:hypothetical protein